MGVLWSCCCGGERDGIASEPLLNNSSVYEPSNITDQQHNNPGSISASHIGAGDVPPINGSLRQIGKFLQKTYDIKMGMNYT